MNESPRTAGAFLINHDFLKPNYLITNFMLILEEQHAHTMERLRTKYVVPIFYPFIFPVPDYDLMESYFPKAIEFYASNEDRLLMGISSRINLAF